PAHCRAELVSLPHGFRRSKSIREEIVRIECITSQKFVHASVDGVRSRTDSRIDHGPGTTSEFGRIRVCLDFEFLKRLNRGLDDLNVLAPVGTRIRKIIHPVEQKNVVEHSIPVHIESALKIQSSQSRSRCHYSWRQYRELIVVPPVQWKFHDLLPINN